MVRELVAQLARRHELDAVLLGEPLLDVALDGLEGIVVGEQAGLVAEEIARLEGVVAEGEDAHALRDAREAAVALVVRGFGPRGRGHEQRRHDEGERGEQSRDVYASLSSPPRVSSPLSGVHVPGSSGLQRLSSSDRPWRGWPSKTRAPQRRFSSGSMR